ncbi:DUF1254 domain-containing protein [Aequorivita sp. SDUM287046]|uniref:DUF1254 domain-containing protein n=1 Tax=Aequorivita aurantiaca TaxID=3053356 RepID=A0ABT8DM43_9FLAO|nr:DUF1254 domain-containing protein [Aequorivita aurantiaca]MDN3724205.1 DUF1254 domain-containing protein [Aequorivita aurantiaca]
MKLQLKFMIIASFVFTSGYTQSEKSLSKEEAREIAKEAYVYGLPLVLNYKTFYANTINENSGDYKGEINKKSCEARLYTPNDKAIVTVNSDTPYCMFWNDVRTEPVVVTVPEIDPNRYYSFQFIDLYTHNFAYVGSLTTGSKAGKYLIALKDWEGDVPEGISEVIRTETGIFFTIVRTQLMDANDLENVKSVQNSYQLETLSEYLGEAPKISTNTDAFPEWVEGSQFTEASFTYLDAVLKLIKTPDASEIELLKRFKKLGISTPEGYDFASFSPEIQEAIKQGVKDGFSSMEAFIAETNKDPLASSKIFGSRKFLEQSAKDNYNLENIYLIRAVAAHLGIYGNSALEATYPTFLVDADGNPMDASKNNYTLTFKANSLPPVKAFWSLTMYDGKTQLLVENDINRYLVNSNMKDGFVKNENGSLTIYVQKNSPGKLLESNWLPAPDGPFYTVLRLYGPKNEVLDGTWITPKMEKQTK